MPAARKRHLFISALLVCIAGFSLLVVVPKVSAASCFPDVGGHWAESFICWLSSNGIVSGYPDGTYWPGEKVTRGKMAVFIQRVHQLGENTFSLAGHDRVGEEWSGNVSWSSGAFKVWNHANGPSISGADDGNGDAVRGDGYVAGATGVYGEGDAGPGVTGRSESYRGVEGYGSTGYGGWFQSDNDLFDLALAETVGRINTDPNDEISDLLLSSNNDVIVRLDNDGGEAAEFSIRDSGGTPRCTVDKSGNLSCTGSKRAIMQTADCAEHLLYAVEGPEVWAEDFGTASLTDGHAWVPFEEILAQTISAVAGYQVFLTLVCNEAVFLFVSAKEGTGFSVEGQTLGGAKSNWAFDFHIVAKRAGHEDIRLEPVD